MSRLTGLTSAHRRGAGVGSPWRSWAPTLSQLDHGSTHLPVRTACAASFDRLAELASVVTGLFYLALSSHAEASSRSTELFRVFERSANALAARLCFPSRTARRPSP